MAVTVRETAARPVSSSEILINAVQYRNFLWKLSEKLDTMVCISAAERRLSVLSGRRSRTKIDRDRREGTAAGRSTGDTRDFVRVSRSLVYQQHCCLSTIVAVYVAKPAVSEIFENKKDAIRNRSFVSCIGAFSTFGEAISKCPSHPPEAFNSFDN